MTKRGTWGSLSYFQFEVFKSSIDLLFRVVTLGSTIRLMKPGCFISSIDPPNFFNAIPILPTFRKCLKFAWRGLLFRFWALPMGLTGSPCIFTRVLKSVFSTLRTLYGLNCLSYIDQSFHIEDSEEACLEATLHAAQLFTRLGFVSPDPVCFSPNAVPRVLRIPVTIFIYA